MAHLHLDDLLDDAEISATMDPGLEALLRRLRAAAEDTEAPQTGHFETFGVAVSPAGEVSVDTSAPGAFGDWVWAAGDLANHIGPQTGLVRGETRTVADILGGDGNHGELEQAPAAPLAAPGAAQFRSVSSAPPPAPAPAAAPAPWTTLPPLPFGTPVVSAAPLPVEARHNDDGVTPEAVFHCNQCATFHSSLPPGMICPCGGHVEARAGIRCDGCGKVVLLAR